MKKHVNGEDIEMTAAEVSAREADIVQLQEKELAQKKTKDEYDNLKASAKAKLIAGEALTEDEANTIVL
jgi:endonuclease/exonuclease/phosphatase family metal-dependent hydrolase